MRKIETLMPVELEEWLERRRRYEEENISETHAEMLETGVMGIVSLLNELSPIIKELENVDTPRVAKYHLESAYNLYKTMEHCTRIMQDRVRDASDYYGARVCDAEKQFNNTGL